MLHANMICLCKYDMLHANMKMLNFAPNGQPYLTRNLLVHSLNDYQCVMRIPRPGFNSQRVPGHGC